MLVELLEVAVALTEDHFLALAVQQGLVGAVAEEEEVGAGVVEAVVVEEVEGVEVGVGVVGVVLVEGLEEVGVVEVVVPRSPCCSDNHICKADWVDMVLVVERSPLFSLQPGQKLFSYQRWGSSAEELVQSYQL